jgi:hypothetical protein
MVVRSFPDASEEWGEFIANNARLDVPAPSAEKVEDDLAAWLGDMHLEGEDDHCHKPATFSTLHVELYRCSWCGNPSAALRKCGGCSKTRFVLCDFHPTQFPDLPSGIVMAHVRSRIGRSTRGLVLPKKKRHDCK